MTWLFWFAFAFTVYTYAGYPLLVWWLSRRRPAPEPAAAPAGWPALTVVISVYNEAGRVEAKVDDLRRQDYPGEVRILFVADGCTDGTVERLQAMPGVAHCAYPDRRGKPTALNLAMTQVDTPIVVFMDVRQRLSQGALRHLVARLHEPGIGGASGELVHVDPRTQTAASIGLYWRYEKWIRKAESRLDSTVGATGALFAMYAADYRPLPADTLLDDLVQPMYVVRSGKRVVMETEALAYDSLQDEVAGERRRKIRTLAGNFQSFAAHPWLLDPRANRLWLQLVSHKLFRLLVPYALVVMLLSALAVGDGFYAWAAAIQAAFYACALIGRWWPASQRLRVVSLATVFTELNLAAVLAFWRFASGRLDARWDKA